MSKKPLKKFRQIDIRLRRKARSLFSGAYRSLVKGQGLIFSDVREYVPGDDVRSISWNLTAKMSKPYVKTFEEDKEAQIILAVDLSSSMDFGSGGASKKETAQMLSASIAFCAKKNKDSLGLLLFSSDVELYIPPKKGEKSHLRILREISGFKRKLIQTDFSKSFDFLSKALKRKSHIFIFSDFLTGDSFEKSMRKLGQKHELINLVFIDALEKNIPPLGMALVEDMETGESRLADFSSPLDRKLIKSSLEEKIRERDKRLAKCRADRVFIDCQKDIYRPLTDFFQRRAKMA